MRSASKFNKIGCLTLGMICW